MEKQFSFKFEGKGKTYFASLEHNLVVVRWICEYDHEVKMVDYSIERTESNINNGLWVITDDDIIDKHIVEDMLENILKTRVYIG